MWQPRPTIGPMSEAYPNLLSIAVSGWSLSDMYRAALVVVEAEKMTSTC